MIPCYNIIEIKKILIFFDLTKAINYTMKDIQGKHVDYQPFNKPAWYCWPPIEIVPEEPSCEESELPGSTLSADTRRQNIHQATVLT